MNWIFFQQCGWAPFWFPRPCLLLCQPTSSSTQNWRSVQKPAPARVPNYLQKINQKTNLQTKMRLLCNNLSRWTKNWTLARPFQSMTDCAVISARVPCLHYQHQQQHVLTRGLITTKFKQICQPNRKSSTQRLASSYTNSSFAIFAAKNDQILSSHSISRSKNDFAKRFYRYTFNNKKLK